MTDLDSPRRNNDCYFYYYSTCTKGDSCTFRHEPSALGCETMCSFWKEGKCLNVHCNYRHMELRKNRKAIQCYWETQPGGCLKPHCPFLHQNAGQSATNDNTSTNENNLNNTENNSENTEEISKSPKKNGIESAPSDRNFRSQVDSLVVSFEEESDTESIPTKSPIKRPVKKVKVKTLEEIKLERIQEESAAYFAYSLDHPDNDSGEDLRRNLMRKRKRNILDDSQNSSKMPCLDTYRANTIEPYSIPKDTNLFSKINNTSVEGATSNNNNLKTDSKKAQNLLGIKNTGIRRNIRKEKKGLDTIKIKTLEEIRAEKRRNSHDSGTKIESNEFVAEISSTTKDEDESKKKGMAISKSLPQKKKVKLLRLTSVDLKETSGITPHQISEERIVPVKSILNRDDVSKVGDATETSEKSCSLEAVELGPQSNSKEEVQQIENKFNEYQEEMLLLEGDLDYEDDGLMSEIDSILSK